MTNTALLTLTFAFGFITVAYEGFADRKGWPIGEMYRSHSSWVRILGVLAMVCAPIAAAVIASGLATAVTIFGGLIVALLLTRLLRSQIQAVTAFALPVLWVLNILIVLP